MSIFVPPPTSNSAPKESAQQAELLRRLSAIPSWQERAQKIDDKLQEAAKTLAAREEKLLVLRGDFDALTIAFWNVFARSLGCEDPAGTIARQQARQRSIGHISIILLTVTMTVLAVVGAGAIPELAAFAGVVGVVTLCVIVVAPFRQIARAQKVSAILKREQQPFWMTAGSIALSNLGITPPLGAKWWWTGRVTIVFVRSLAARFSVDAFECSLIWEDSLESGRDDGLTGKEAAEILKHLITANPRYRQLVDRFSALSLLESELTFLETLEAEAQQKVAEELLRATELPSAQAKGRHRQDDVTASPQDALQGDLARPTPAAVKGGVLGHASYSTEPAGDATGLLSDPARSRCLSGRRSASAKGAAASWTPGLRQNPDRKNPRLSSRAQLQRALHERL